MAKLATLSLKLLVDTVNQRVLFAEAGKDAVDFLFSLLALPLGTVTRLLSPNNKGMVGSVGKLYGSLEVLDSTYVKAGFNKDVLLKPKVPVGVTSGDQLRAFFLAGEHLQLRPAPEKKKYYSCNDDIYYPGGRGYGKRCSNWSSYVTDAMGTPCPSCRRPMNTELTYVLSHKQQTDQVNHAAGNGYVKEIGIYTVMDDLAVQPMSAVSSIALLNKCRVMDVSSLEERTVQLGFDKGLALLKASLCSQTVLTDVFLKRPEY